MKLSLHLRDRKIWLPLAVTLGFFILTVILIFMQSAWCHRIPRINHMQALLTCGLGELMAPGYSTTPLLATQGGSHLV